MKNDRLPAVAEPCKSWVGRDVGRQLVDRRTVTPLRQVRFPGAARDFPPRVHIQCRLSYDVRTTSCAIVYINTCAHDKDPVVHVRVRWIMETLKHPACTVGWVARLCRSLLSPGKATRISHGRRSPIGTMQLQKVKSERTIRATATTTTAVATAAKQTQTKTLVQKTDISQSSWTDWTREKNGYFIILLPKLALGRPCQQQPETERERRGGGSMDVISRRGCFTLKYRP